MLRLLIVMMAMSCVFSGCLLRFRTVEKPRTDLDVSGNAGCLQGECKKTSKASKLSDKRLISVIEFEIGKTKKKLKKEQEELDERQQQVEQYKNDLTQNLDASEVAVEEDEEIVFEASVGDELQEAQAQTYVVRKGDTLQKISQKFYGTTKNYLLLYQANKDIMQSKDSLKVGQKLKIPAK